MARLITAALLVLATSACAASGERSGPRSSRNVITAEEIREVQALTAYEAVERLRPRFLRRGRVSMGDDRVLYPIVYLDNLEIGRIDELRRIRSSEVFRIEYLSGPDATMRFGTGHAGGALLVYTRPPGSN